MAVCVSLCVHLFAYARYIHTHPHSEIWWITEIYMFVKRKARLETRRICIYCNNFNAAWVRPAHREWSLKKSFEFKGRSPQKRSKIPDYLVATRRLSYYYMSSTAKNLDSDGAKFPFKLCTRQIEPGFSKCLHTRKISWHNFHRKPERFSCFRSFFLANSDNYEYDKNEAYHFYQFFYRALIFFVGETCILILMFLSCRIDRVPMAELCIKKPGFAFPFIINDK